MSKFISMFILKTLCSSFIIFLFLNLFDGGDNVETAIYTFGTLIVILLTLLISLIYYLIDIIKMKFKFDFANIAKKEGYYADERSVEWLF